MVSLVIWVVISAAVAWARPTPPASLFGQTRLEAVVVAEAPAAGAGHCGPGC
jgi:hypothetical protein